MKEFGINPLSILEIKGAIRSLSSTEAQAIAETALTLSTAEEVEKVLQSKKALDYCRHTGNGS